MILSLFFGFILIKISFNHWEMEGEVPDVITNMDGEIKVKGQVMCTCN